MHGSLVSGGVCDRVNLFAKVNNDVEEPFRSGLEKPRLPRLPAAGCYQTHGTNRAVMLA